MTLPSTKDVIVGAVIAYVVVWLVMRGTIPLIGSRPAST